MSTYARVLVDVGKLIQQRRLREKRGYVKQQTATPPQTTQLPDNNLPALFTFPLPYSFGSKGQRMHHICDLVRSTKGSRGLEMSESGISRDFNT
jgi:hypothetical protein